MRMRFMLWVWASCLFGPDAISWLDYMLFGCQIFFLVMWCKDGGNVDVERCGRLSVHDGLGDVAWFCVCKLGGGGWWKCECVGRQKGLIGRCLICVTSMHYATSPEHTLVIQGGSLGVLVGGVMYVIWRMFAFFGLSQYFLTGFFRLLFLHVDCDCNRPFFIATVFWNASAFNGVLNQWNVAKVTDMSYSKSIRIVEND